MAEQWRASPGGGLLVRGQRHQCARDPRGGVGARGDLRRRIRGRHPRAARTVVRCDPVRRAAPSEPARCPGCSRARARRPCGHRLSACASTWTDPELDLADVGLSLASRSAFEHRAVVLGGEREGLLGWPFGPGGGGARAGVLQGVASRPAGAGPVFMFPGQGSQWEGMALELLDSSPVFAEHMRACGRGAWRACRLVP